MRKSSMPVTVVTQVGLHGWKITVVWSFDLDNISRHSISRRNWKTGSKIQVLHLVFTLRREKKTNE
jgi:hypothetical protein